MTMQRNQKVKKHYWELCIRAKANFPLIFVTAFVSNIDGESRVTHVHSHYILTLVHDAVIFAMPRQVDR